MTVESRWYWPQHPRPLQTMQLLLDLPLHDHSSGSPAVYATLSSPAADGRRRLSARVQSGQELATFLAANGVAEEQVVRLITSAPMKAYLNRPEEPHRFYLTALGGSLSTDWEGTYITWNADFPEAFYLDWHPPWEMPAGVLEQYRRDSVPQNQALWVTQVCSVLRQLRPAAMVATRQLMEPPTGQVWSGTELRIAFPPDQLVMAYVQNDVPAVGLPGFLEPVAFLDGWLLWNPAALVCDVAAVAARNKEG